MSDKPVHLLRITAVHFILLVGVWPTLGLAEENIRFLKELFDKGQSNVVKGAGCRVLPDDAVLVKKSPLMTLLWCTKQCWKEATLYANVKAGDHCFCSQRIGEVAGSSECNIPCRNAKSQTCGGSATASAMFTGFVKLRESRVASLFAAFKANKKRLSGQITGKMKKYDKGKCVRWKPKGRSFSSLIMTVEICIIHCFHNKFVYALLSIGGTCTCTSDSPPEKPGGRPMEKILAEGERDACTWKCNGNKKQTCGGMAYVHSVWITGHFRKTDALYDNPYFAMPPLKQEWSPFLVNNTAILKELSLGRGVLLSPPPGVAPTEETESTVEEVPIDSDEGAVPTPVIVGCVLGAVGLVGLFIAVSQCVKRKKPPDYEKVEKQKKGGSADQKGRQDKSRVNRKEKEERRSKSGRRHHSPDDRRSEKQEKQTLSSPKLQQQKPRDKSRESRKKRKRNVPQ